MGNSHPLRKHFGLS